MNRLTATYTPPKAPAARSRPATAAPQSSPTHCLLAPLHYERNYAYPLIVWLHGAGSSERELHDVMPEVSLRNYVSVGVRGLACETSGYDWPQTPAGIAAAESRVAAAVADARQRFNIHPQRIFLAGANRGGTMALRLALREPECFAAAASLGGAFPEQHAPLAGLHRARRVKLLIAHCRDSETYSIARVCDELALFHAAGMNVTLRQYPCADELTTLMLRDLDVWLMEQVTGIPAAEAQEPAPLPSQWN